VIPTVIANAFYLPHHLLPKKEPEELAAEQGKSRPLTAVSTQAE
jgi:hypothetical protein